MGAQRRSACRNPCRIHEAMSDTHYSWQKTTGELEKQHSISCAVEVF